ncbi:transposase zinc-binding domain-containing protein [Leisingera sp. M523]|uniref:transposase zinc-binding domain-containing protein n=1 Tax=Leisingera sp. M523 TaxID=2867013 RepID=UPI0021A5D173|nr:transposase zinc-binding domain-containing protein [Leisingera sp. M523]
MAYNSYKNRYYPKCQGPAARGWLAARAEDLLPLAVLPYGLRPAVPRLGRIGHDPRRRPQAPRRPRRNDQRAPHLGISAGASSPHPHDHPR